MKLSELSTFLDSSVPLSFQEEWDNSGLQVGNPDMEINSTLIALDVTEAVVEEAIRTGSDLILSHHPLIFSGIRKITGRSSTERIIMDSVRNNIAVYSAHTNLDMVSNGVSRKMAQKLGLENISVLRTLKNKLLKLVTFVPEEHLDRVRNAIFNAGAGVTGNYDLCGFTAEGTGSFRGGENTKPFAGKKGILHFEKETRFETVLYTHLKDRVIKALLGAHPYEEVAYDIYALDNDNIDSGLGCIGELPEAVDEIVFLNKLKSVFGAEGIRYSKLTGRPVKKVALCGGSGASLLNDAVKSGADAFVTGDIKYHAFFEPDNRLLLVDCGHYETEKFSVEILYDLIVKKFPNFAVRFSETNTNPINYL
ncbi:MAG: Nif3-like dinuclear metal center hexameric protein [Bacteroidales bacterium]|jgi:dinuclear metal center YbgI/SA1388 family protein|nr:Nif3-like dinuclear metal center hexameric protein [Bacteroidales bacterium]